MARQTCNSCGADRIVGDIEEFFVKCCECGRVWHNSCLYERVPSSEIELRNRQQAEGMVDGGWYGWMCRACRGVGPEGREHWAPPQPEVYDLTLSSDSEETIQPPSTTTAPPQTNVPPPQPNVPPPQPNVPPPQTTAPQTSNLPPSDDIIEILSDDEEVHIADQKPTQGADLSGDSIIINPPETQDSSIVDINDLSLDDQRPLHYGPPPAFPFPEPTPFERRLGPAAASPLPSPPLPPALRPSTRSLLGQRMVEAMLSDKIVQMVGLKELKAAGWKLERRERDTVSVEPLPLRLRLDKGKGRAFGERTRDWTPLVRREQERAAEAAAQEANRARLRTVVEMRLIPPRPQAPNLTLGPNAHPPRKPRKTTTVVHRDDAVKLEPVEFSLS